MRVLSEKYWVNQKRVREILDEYIKINNINSREVCFIICSDGKIEKDKFEGLNTKISDKNLIEDFLILSMTDVILGSDSSFGNLASYFGDISHIVFKNEQVDWNYYSNKNKFFENKYCTMVHY